MSHFVNICQYGHAHGQCRCPSPNKAINYIKCDVGGPHAERYGPYSKDFVIQDKSKVVDNIRKALIEIEAAFSTYTMTGTNGTHVYISTMRDVFNQITTIREELDSL